MKRNRHVEILLGAVAAAVWIYIICMAVPRLFRRDKMPEEVPAVHDTVCRTRTYDLVLSYPVPFGIVSESPEVPVKKQTGEKPRVKRDVKIYDSRYVGRIGSGKTASVVLEIDGRYVYPDSGGQDGCACRILRTGKDTLAVLYGTDTLEICIPED